MNCDFGNPVRFSEIRDGERIDLHASEAECTKIANRLDLHSIERLKAHAVLERVSAGVRATGRVSAMVWQRCAVTDEPIQNAVDERFELMFLPDPALGEAEAEIELAAEDCDTVFFDGGSIELGNAIADTLALSIDPYPRSAGAETALREAGVIGEGETGPFAALAALKKGLNEE